MIGQDNRISPRQWMILVIFYLLGSSLLAEAKYLASDSGRDVWLTASLGMIVSLGLVWMYISLARRFPSMSLTEYSEFLLGKRLGKFISLLFFAYTMIMFMYTMFTFQSFITSTLLPRTNSIMLYVVYALMIVWNVRLGIGNIARVAEWFFPALMGLFVLVFALEIPYAEPNIIRPFFQYGFSKTVKSVIDMFTSPYAQLAIFLMIYPSLRKGKQQNKSFYYGVLIGGMLLTTMIVLNVMVLGIGITSKSLFPSFDLARIPELASFLTGWESVFSVSWLVAQVTQGCLLFYVSVLNLAQIFKIRNPLPITMPLLLIALAFVPTLLPPDTAFNWKFWPLFIMTFGVAIPLVLWVISWIKPHSFHEENEKK